MMELGWLQDLADMADSHLGLSPAMGLNRQSYNDSLVLAQFMTHIWHRENLNTDALPSSVNTIPLFSSLLGLYMFVCMCEITGEVCSLFRSSLKRINKKIIIISCILMALHEPKEPSNSS